MLRKYITAAHERMQTDFDARAKVWYTIRLRRRERIYAHAMQVGDYRTALAADIDGGKLQGLYDLETRERVERLEAKLNAALQDQAGPDRAPDRGHPSADAGGGPQPGGLPE
jgi:hypothetical protein